MDLQCLATLIRVGGGFVWSKTLWKQTRNAREKKSNPPHIDKSQRHDRLLTYSRRDANTIQRRSQRSIESLFRTSKEFDGKRIVNWKYKNRSKPKRRRGWIYHTAAGHSVSVGRSERVKRLAFLRNSRCRLVPRCHNRAQDFLWPAD